MIKNVEREDLYRKTLADKSTTTSPHDTLPITGRPRASVGAERVGLGAFVLEVYSGQVYLADIECSCRYIIETKKNKKKNTPYVLSGCVTTHYCSAALKLVLW